MIGYALCGSFCTHKKSVEELKNLISHGYDVLPIMSENVYSTDTRFGKAAELIPAELELRERCQLLERRGGFNIVIRKVELCKLRHAHKRAYIAYIVIGKVQIRKSRDINKRAYIAYAVV